MNKDALIAKVSKHGLLTTGNVDTRRCRSHTAATQLPHQDFTTRLAARPDTLTSDGASGWPEAGEQHTVVYQHLASESANIREILGLSPNADLTMVQRALTSLLLGASDPNQYKRPVHRAEDPAYQYGGLL